MVAFNPTAVPAQMVVVEGDSAAVMAKFDELALNDTVAFVLLLAVQPFASVMVNE